MKNIQDGEKKDLWQNMREGSACTRGEGIESMWGTSHPEMCSLHPAARVLLSLMQCHCIPCSAWDLGLTDILLSNWVHVHWVIERHELPDSLQLSACRDKAAKKNKPGKVGKGFGRAHEKALRKGNKGPCRIHIEVRCALHLTRMLQHLSCEGHAGCDAHRKL